MYASGIVGLYLVAEIAARDTEGVCDSTLGGVFLVEALNSLDDDTSDTAISYVESSTALQRISRYLFVPLLTEDARTIARRAISDFAAVEQNY